MEQQEAAPGYYIWGVDNNAYGPIELPTLVNWIKDDRVIAETWVFADVDQNWQKAAEIPELQMFFRKKQPASVATPMTGGELAPGALRRIKALVDMTDEQLTALLRYLEVISVASFAHVVHKGEPGDAMCGVLQGELRSCIILEGKERPLATLGPGSVFGELSMFDRGPHAADVIANEDSQLIRLSIDALARFGKEEPDAARALLFGLIRAIAGRVRTLTRRYEDSVQTAQRVESVMHMPDGKPGLPPAWPVAAV
jgi:CRP-like cAMP-binding protein